MNIPSETQNPDRTCVLVADDDPIAQMVLKKILEQAGYEPDFVSDGREAVQALKSKNYDLVLMDCLMPNMDGYEATRLIRGARKSAINSRIPIVALTGLDAKDQRAQCLNAGMDNWLSKPVDPDKLIAAVEQCLGRPRPVQSTTQQNEADRTPARDDEFLSAVIDKFLVEVPRVIDELQQAVEQGNAITLRNIGHRMRGVSHILEISTLSTRSRALEQAGESEDMQLAGRLASELIEDLNKLVSALTA